MTTTTTTPAPLPQLDANADALAFATAGNATFTLVSTATGARYTYKVQAPSMDTPAGGRTRDFAARIRFVKLLNGPCNETSFGYIGCLRLTANGWSFAHGAGKATAGADATSVKAFGWWSRNASSAKVEVHHASKCGKCGRKLTVPESIARGLGPRCRGEVVERAA